MLSSVATAGLVAASYSTRDPIASIDKEIFCVHTDSANCLVLCLDYEVFSS